MAKTFDEHFRGGLAATAKGEVQNQFRAALDCDKAVRVSDGFIVSFLRPLVAFLLLDEAPNLITLYIFNRHVDDHASHQSFAFFSSQGEQPHDGIPVEVRDAFCGANRVPFDQEPKSQDYFFLGDVATFQSRFVRLSKCLFAYRAAKSAKTISMRAIALTASLASFAS